MSSGKDIIGIAETGSGKTFAFALPGAVHVLGNYKGKVRLGWDRSAIFWSSIPRKSIIFRFCLVNIQRAVPMMLVLAPTRELAMQSAEVIEKAVASSHLRSFCLYGGVPKAEQKKALREG